MSSFPRGILDSPPRFARVLGSFWHDVAGPGTQFLSLLQGYGVANDQLTLTAREVSASATRQSILPFRQRLWYRLTLKESDRNSAATSPLTYNANQAEYGADGTAPYDKQFLYGDAAPGTGYRFPITAGLRRVQQISDNPRQPTSVLVNEVDYKLTDTYIEFKSDPFKLYSTRSTVNDREIDLWLFRADFDHDDIYNLYGYVVGVPGESSVAYRDLINAYWDALILGTSDGVLRRLLSAVTGSPLARATETVQYVVSEPRRKQVITNLNVYDIPLEASITVGVGDVLIRGDWMCDLVEITEDISDQLGLSLDQGLLNLPLKGSLTFRNQTSTSTYTLDADNQADVQFSIDGFPEDIETFWNAIKAQNSTSFLDALRAIFVEGTHAANEGGEELLPESGLSIVVDGSEIDISINPMQLLLHEVLTSNIIFVKVKSSSAGVGMDALTLLRQVTPAHTLIMFLVTLNVPVETFGGSYADNNPALGLGNAVTMDVLTYPSYEDGNIRIRTVEDD